MPACPIVQPAENPYSRHIPHAPPGRRPPHWAASGASAAGHIGCRKVRLALRELLYRAAGAVPRHQRPQQHSKQDVVAAAAGSGAGSFIFGVHSRLFGPLVRPRLIHHPYRVGDRLRYRRVWY